MQHDVCFGNAVVMTVTDIHAATDLAKALDVAAQSGFQVEGLRSHVVEVNRSSAPPAEKEPEMYSLNVEDTISLHVLDENENELRANYELELVHPRHPGGRKGVLDAIQERLGELELGVDS